LLTHETQLAVAWYACHTLLNENALSLDLNLKKQLLVIVLSCITLGFWVLTSFIRSADVSEFYSIAKPPFAETFLVPNPETDDVFIYLVFPFGEAANPLDEGLAHYVEHLAWINAFGTTEDGVNRHSNAWTNLHSTGYWLRSAQGDLNSALRTLLKVADTLSVDPEFAAQERDIVQREYDLRVGELPLYAVTRDMDRALFGDSAFARSVIGEPDTIAGYTLDMATGLHARSHRLRDATLLVYGNITQAQFEAAVDRLSDQRETPSPNIIDQTPWLKSEILDDRLALSIPNIAEDTFLYRKLVPLDTCGTAARCAMIVQLIEDVLDSTLPGGLAGPLRYDHFIARSFAIDLEIIADTHLVAYFTANPDVGVSIDELETAFTNTINLTLENGIPDETFARVHSRLEGRFDSILLRDRPKAIRDIILRQLSNGGPVFTLSDQQAALANIHADDVNGFLKALLVDGREVSRLITVER
jgi:predicted Zn-dependent peptidase